MNNRCILSLVIMTLLVPLAAANHVQNANVSGATFSVQFDHDGDNEWWVEVLTKASMGDSVVAMEARPESSHFRGLQQKAQVDGWTKWGPETSFRIPSGDRVMFRAHVLDGPTSAVTTIDSCWFTHPAGVEQCTASPPPPPPGGFDATFTSVRGNEWWVQANVATNGPAITKVDVTLDRGQTFRPLSKQSWGATAWAASYHIVQGTIVQMRATASDGQSELSSCRQWIPPSNTDATIVQCGSTPPPPPDKFDATFSNVRGNEYWMEAVIKANEEVHGVFVYFDCDPNFEPHDMSYHANWGKWALGVRIPAGTRVTMVAFGDHGTDASQGYIWPKATPTSGCPPPPDWPKEGSFADYDLFNDVSGGGASESLRARLHLEFHFAPGEDFGFWTGTCTGTYTHRAADGTVTTQQWTAPSNGYPPVMTRTPRAGMQQPNLLTLPAVEHVDDDCAPDGFQDFTSTVMGTKTVATRGFGTMTLWYTDENDGGAGSEEREIQWETDVGLVIHWERSGRMSGMAQFGGDLIRTDAPLR